MSIKAEGDEVVIMMTDLEKALGATRAKEIEKEYFYRNIHQVAPLEETLMDLILRAEKMEERARNFPSYSIFSADDLKEIKESAQVLLQDVRNKLSDKIR